MKIAIDISQIVYGTGVSFYIKELVAALAEIDHQNDYLLFAGVRQQKQKLLETVQSLNLPSNFTTKTFPIPPRIQAKIWNNLHVLNLELLVGEFDLYHSPDWSLAPTKKPKIITVHDLFFIKHPELQQHPFQSTLEKRLARARQQRLRAIAVSEATKQDLIKLIDYPQELITVIHEAPPTFIPASQQPSLKELERKYTLPKKYLLMVATREPRKNLETTLQAFANLTTVGENKQFGLVIAGKMGWGTQELEKYTLAYPNIHFTGYIPDTDLAALYANAKAFLYPSLYEGFGLPILQAFQYQTPVLTSNLSSMPEVAGDAAILIDPYDQASIEQGINKMITLSEAEQATRIKKGQQQLKKFSWEKVAQQTMALYQKTATL